MENEKKNEQLSKEDLEKVSGGFRREFLSDEDAPKSNEHGAAFCPICSKAMRYEGKHRGFYRFICDYCSQAQNKTVAFEKYDDSCDWFRLWDL